ncbi:MAG: UvrD-helicase domain-containing protein, partial [Patescibacteria group bacterium]
MAEDLFKNLNPQQIEAVKHLNGPALVVAGPGSGKTRVLTHRIAYLIESQAVSESNILCVTFTNKAADEIKTRIGNLTDSFGGKLSWGGTFHSVCSRILRKDGYHIGIPLSFVIYDTDDQVSLIRQILNDFGIDKKKTNPNAVLSTISGAKSELIGPQEYAGYANGYFQRTVAKIYPEYQKRLRKNDALDFDDLLVETVNLFQSHDAVLDKYQNYFMQILVDEYQDTNKAQYVITKLLSSAHRNLYVVGDMSQAIYSFRGADYRNILNFQKDYEDAVIYNLEQNYRSTQNILDAAKNIIKNNSTHIPLDLWTNNGTGEKIVSYTGRNEKDEASFVVEKILESISGGKDYQDIAVLYRTNAQSRNMEELLIKNNIPYKIIGGLRFYSRKEIKDVVAYLRVIYNPKDTVSWERIINTPPRGIGQKKTEELKAAGWDLKMIEEVSKLPVSSWVEKSTHLSTVELMDEVLFDTKYIEWLDDGSEESQYRVENIKELRSVASQFVELDTFLENVALIESVDRPRNYETNAITLMTIHAAKGLEFPVVFVIGMEEGLFPHSQSMMDISELEEERRLCYVAVTRAKEKLFLTNALSR